MVPNYRFVSVVASWGLEMLAFWGGGSGLGALNWTRRVDGGLMRSGGG